MEASSRSGRRRLAQALTILAVVLIVWLLAGLLRGDLAARDWFARIHDGQTVTNVETQLGPALPPFWSVSIGGDVTQPGQTSPAYRSQMTIWVEPISGWVIQLNAG